MTQRAKHLEKLSAQWESAERMRNFVRAVSEIKEDLGELRTGYLGIEEWLDWPITT